ncbi:MAG: cupin domain-containing protein [Saccharothrix sp.]|nr:cupin domain-containing protein [Saccharothrix sp.]
MITVIPADSAEVVALSGDSAFRLLADGGTFGVNRLTLDVGVDGAKPHLHRRSSELFYVLDGVLEFRHEGTTTVDRGGVVLVPPGVPHAFGAAPGHRADLLVVLTPGVERFDYFRHLGRIARGADTGEALRAEQDRYDVHFTG